LGKPEQLCLNAGKTTKRYRPDNMPGHAAWLDGSWKLHRIAGKKGKKVQFELYNLADDPREQNNVIGEHHERAEKMKAELDAWQQSVIDSLNGRDYHSGS
jgi:hypothetical protein